MNIYNHKYYALVSIIFTIFAVPSFIAWLFYICYGFWCERKIIHLFKNKSSNLMRNMGYPKLNQNYLEGYKEFYTSLSIKNKKVINKMIQKGILLDNPFKVWGAGLYSDIYLMSFKNSMMNLRIP